MKPVSALKLVRNQKPQIKNTAKLEAAVRTAAENLIKAGALIEAVRLGGNDPLTAEAAQMLYRFEAASFRDALATLDQAADGT